ncbi:MAG: lyase family protein [Cypionkella sp.]|nr:lyase family protein [Cypionkella sp.]
MPAHPADSAIYSGLLGDVETARLFSDSAEIRAMLLVEGALAKVQGAAGLIPTEAAAYIERAAREVVIDPAALSAETARNGVPVPALLTAFRKEANAPDLMHYLHWGATSQDIMDTGLALRLRRVLDIWQLRLREILAQLAALADTHADLPMAARSYGQIATPTTFGAVVAAWGWPLISHHARLDNLRQDVLKVSLSGAAGTLSAMGAQGPAIRAALAIELDLADPARSWHSDRSGITALAGFAASAAASLGKLGEDLILMTQSGIGEVTIGGAGGSSTMPQKQNPVGPSALVALARFVIGQASVLQGAGLHRGQRDGAAWFAEWLTLPQTCIALSRMLTLASETLAGLHPNAQAMQNQMFTAHGSLYAEALTFALSRAMPRPAAEAEVKRLLTESAARQLSLLHFARQSYTWLDIDQLVAHSLGTAMDDARAFAKGVKVMA